MISDNIFNDIKVSNPKEAKKCSDVMLAIAQVIKKKKLTKMQVAEILNIPQSRASCLINGKLSMFSLDNLLEYLNDLHGEAVILIKNEVNK